MGEPGCPTSAVTPPGEDTVLRVGLAPKAVHREGPGAGRAGGCGPLLGLEVQMLLRLFPQLSSPPDGHLPHETGVGWTPEVALARSSSSPRLDSGPRGGRVAFPTQTSGAPEAEVAPNSCIGKRSPGRPAFPFLQACSQAHVNEDRKLLGNMSPSPSTVGEVPRITWDTCQWAPATEILTGAIPGGARLLPRLPESPVPLAWPL